jgi:predicted RNA binding protein YcfA (HicA-like mRNA interferase family)
MGLSQLPLASGTRHIRALRRLGFAPAPGRPGRGDHVVLVHPDGRMLTVPKHKEVRRATLKDGLDGARITIEEYLAVYR